MHVKKGDNVIVTTGKDKGKSGTVERAFPKKGLILVSGINIVKRHQRSRTNEGKGQIVDKSMPIHASNVKLGGAGTKKEKKAAKKAK